MPDIDIPREQWTEFLDTFSRKHRAWLTTIEPSVRGIEARPLRAVEPVRERGVLSAIEISFAGDSGGDTIRVEHPVALRLRQTAEGADRAIEIIDDEGPCTRAGCRTTIAPSDIFMDPWTFNQKNPMKCCAWLEIHPETSSRTRPSAVGRST